MAQPDVAVVGGGIGGACVARALAEAGLRVLVLERETRFKDQVRGEVLWSWGVAEAKTLGHYDLLRDACGHDVFWFDIHLGPQRADHFDLVGRSAQPALNFAHPEMQEVLLQAAEDAGAEVRRGALVQEVCPGRPPRVVWREGETRREAEPRFAVCANGKQAEGVTWAGLPVRRDNIGLMVAGVLLDGVSGPAADTNYWIINPQLGQAAFLAPQRDGRVRSYLLHSKTREYRLRGKRDLRVFLDELAACCAPDAWFRDATSCGPLATFDGTDTWVDHPYREGVALVGDAAASSDPSYGQGMSLTTRDARVLRDHLLASDDWDAAGHAYAEEHDRYYRVINTAIHWFWDLFYEIGPEADARRARSFPKLADDVQRVPDILLTGPEAPSDETVRRRFYGEV